MGMVISVVKAVLVIVIMVAMVLILLGINHLFSGNFATREQDAERMRHDVDHKEDVITDDSVFHNLVSNERGRASSSGRVRHR